jgi:hypothetical protein
MTRNNWTPERNGIREDIQDALPDPTKELRTVADKVDEIEEANAWGMLCTRRSSRPSLNSTRRMITQRATISYHLAPGLRRQRLAQPTLGTRQSSHR